MYEDSVVGCSCVDCEYERKLVEQFEIEDAPNPLCKLHGEPECFTCGPECYDC